MYKKEKIRLDQLRVVSVYMKITMPLNLMKPPEEKVESFLNQSHMRLPGIDSWGNLEVMRDCGFLCQEI